MMTMDLAGKVAIVTGASSGIGEAVARTFGQAGAAVAVNSSSSVEAGRAVAESLPQGLYVQGDVSDDDACHAVVNEVLSRFGRIDILVNNAGTTKVIAHADLDAATDLVWRRIFDVNVLGAWHMTRASLPALRASGAGVVVNVSSIAGVRPVGSSIPYAASKAALNHMTILLANVLGPEVRVNAVAPGLVDTPWTADWDAVRAAVREQAPLKRSATPQDVADAVAGLVTSTFVTGQVLCVDGGMSLR
jgi:ketoreductase RED2